MSNGYETNPAQGSEPDLQQGYEEDWAPPPLPPQAPVHSGGHMPFGAGPAATAPAQAGVSWQQIATQHQQQAHAPAYQPPSDADVRAQGYGIGQPQSLSAAPQAAVPIPGQAQDAFAPSTVVPASAPARYADSAGDVGRHRVAAAMGHVEVQPAGKLPPKRGWRRWLLLLTRINMGMSPDEEYERELHARIRKQVMPPQGTVQGFQVAIVSLKGGVGKTTLTVLLGSVIAMIRGERVLAVDANPDGGNLVDRATQETTSTVAQLVSEAPSLTGYNAVRKHTNQNDANLEVLASADYVDAAHEFNKADWNTTSGVVSPYYPIVFADCGVGLHTDATRAVLDSVWALVVVTSPSVDAAKASGQVFDWLRANGYADLASRSVAVINYRDHRKGKAKVEDIKAQLEVVVGEHNVFVMPFDNHIEEGRGIDLQLVSSTVRRRCTEIAAALSHWFDQPPQRPVQ